MMSVKFFEHKFHIIDLAINLGFMKRFQTGNLIKEVNVRS